MISDIVFSGYLGEKEGIVRYVLCESKKNCFDDQTKISKIPTIYWSRNDRNLLFKLKKGDYVVVKGRLEYLDEVGLVVLVELIQHPYSLTKELS